MAMNERRALEQQAVALSGTVDAYYEFVDELPKTATGKIQRFKLR